MEYTELESSTKHIGTCQDIVKKKAKIAIIGPGSIGSLFSAHLYRAGVDVLIIDYKRERAHSIIEKGLILESSDGKSVVTWPRVSLIGELQTLEAEFIVLCVKAYSLRPLMPSIVPLVGKESIFIAVQNGIGYWDDIKGSGQDIPLLLCSTAHGAHKKGENRVLHAGSGPTYIGPYKKGDDPREVEAGHMLEEILNDAGLSSLYQEDIYPHLWKKLVINCAINPLTAITMRKNGQLLEDPALMDLQEKIVGEVLQVADKVGISMRLTIGDAVGLVQDVCRMTSENISSMLQDVLRGSQTEIDYINGAVARLGDAYGVRATVNWVLTTLVKAIVSKNVLTNPAPYD